MDEYIEKLISQIRCKKARPYIADEIRGHIEEQVAYNKENGMTDEEAEKNAVLDMGDPVDVGISLDKIHKPQIGWKVIATVGLISLIAILIQWAFCLSVNNYDLEMLNNANYRYSVRGFVGNTILGMVLMIIIYYVDYTWIAKYSKAIGFLIIGSVIYTYMFGPTVNGINYRIAFAPISVTAFMMMYIPVYGAIIYKYRKGRFGAMIKCLLWLIIPVWITLRLPSFVVAVIMTISMLTQLTIAIYKGWFQINKKACIIGIWSVFILLPVVSLFGMYSFHLLAEYQEMRIKCWLNLNSNVGNGYTLSEIRKFSQNVSLIGKSREDIFGQLPSLNSDYVFTYVLNTYGSIAGILIIAVLAVLILFIFSAVMKQKNELGITMGTGCGMLLLMNAVINILCAIGALPTASSFLPFFSAGGSNIILCYVLIGIVLSIYKYKNIYPQNVMDKVMIKKKLRS